jgi:hypothetical protein
LSLHIERQTKALFPNGESTQLTDEALNIAAQQLKLYENVRDDKWRKQYLVDFGPLPSN